MIDDNLPGFLLLVPETHVAENTSSLILSILMF
jgi:hypothetical protein